MHTLDINTEVGEQEMAIFWVIELIRYTSLEYGKFDIWNIKVNCKPSILDELRNFQKTKDLLGKKWVKVMDSEISISLIEIHVRDQSSLIEDGKEKA